MRIFVELDNGLLPDRFGKHAPEAYQLDGHPVRSFPIEIADVPKARARLRSRFSTTTPSPWAASAGSIGLRATSRRTRRSFPRTPAPRASWLAYRARTAIGRLWQAAIPTRGSSIVTRARTRLTRRTTTRWTVYALDCELGLSEGYFLNEFRRAVRGHVLDEASLELPSRA